MSNMLKSFGIVIALSILLFFILKLAGIPAPDAAKLALTPFTIIAFVYSKLEELDKAKHSDDKLQSLNDFSLPLWKTYLLGTITGLALLELVGGIAAVLGGIIGSLHKVPVSTALEIVNFAIAPLSFYIMFATGRWTGIRAARRAILIAAFIGVTCRLLDLAISLTLPGASIKTMFPDADAHLKEIAFGYVLGCLLYAALACAGAWFGRRKRQSSYLTHLLKSIPAASRSALVDIAYEEAQKSVTIQPQLRRAIGV